MVTGETEDGGEAASLEQVMREASACQEEVRVVAALQHVQASQAAFQANPSRGVRHWPTRSDILADSLKFF